MTYIIKGVHRAFKKYGMKPKSDRGVSLKLVTRTEAINLFHLWCWWEKYDDFHLSEGLFKYLGLGIYPMPRTILHIWLNLHRHLVTKVFVSPLYILESKSLRKLVPLPVDPQISNGWARIWTQVYLTGLCPTHNPQDTFQLWDLPWLTNSHEFCCPECFPTISPLDCLLFCIGLICHVLWEPFLGHFSQKEPFPALPTCHLSLLMHGPEWWLRAYITVWNLSRVICLHVAYDLAPSSRA